MITISKILRCIIKFTCSYVVGTQKLKPWNLKSKSAKAKAVYRIKKKIPKEANAYASIIHSLISSSNKSQKRAMKEVGIFLARDFINRNLMLKLKGRDKQTENTRAYLAAEAVKQKYRNLNQLSKVSGLSWHVLNRAVCSKEKKIVQKRVDEIIKDTYEEESVELPWKKMVSRKTLKPKRFLEKSLKKVYEGFSQQNKGKVGFSTFAKKRPRHVVPMVKTKLNQCLCEYCVNVELKLGVLNRKLKVNFDKHKLVEISCCSKQEGSSEYMRRCIERKCQDCGTEKIMKKLKSLAQEQNVDNLQILKWMKWERVKTDHKSRIENVEKSGNLDSLMGEIIQESESFGKHLFVAAWQHSQFTKLIKNIPENNIVQVLDFAQNYRCVYQDEVQSAHFGYAQVTLHPIISYYCCSFCPSVIREELVFISSDLSHSASSVFDFSTEATDHLQNVRGIKIEKIIQFTDGCGSQYKSKIPFFHISISDVPLQRSFFGSRHGKGPADGCSGVVKACVTRAVVGRKCIIRNAKDFYEYCQDNLRIEMNRECTNEKHTRRSFFLHASKKNSRQDCDANAAITIPGTRQIHCIQTGSRKGEVMYRNLSCFCDSCIGLNGQKCVNSEYVDEWHSRELMKPVVEILEKKSVDKGRKSERGNL